jgi:hypothetical protein
MYIAPLATLKFQERPLQASNFKPNPDIVWDPVFGMDGPEVYEIVSQTP